MTPIQYWAGVTASNLSAFGLSLTVEETKALAVLIGAVLRSYPVLRKFTPVESPEL